jgi:Ca2+-binding EF-hand superfamily protein
MSLLRRMPARSHVAELSRQERMNQPFGIDDRLTPAGAPSGHIPRRSRMKKSRTNHKLLSLMLMGGVALAGSAFANNQGDTKFKSMDTNNDGQISSAEHSAGVTRMFSTMDANKDGFVTSTEMDASHKGMKASSDKGMKKSASSKISSMDTDGDGKLSSAEHDAGATTMFTKMDTDGNGSVSQAEMSSAHATMMKDDKAKGAMHDHGTTDSGSTTEQPNPPPSGNGS